PSVLLTCAPSGGDCKKGTRPATRSARPSTRGTAMTEPDRTTSTGLSPGHYRLRPDESSVHYTGKHMFGLGTVHATFGVREGALLIDDAQALSEVTIVVDAASFASDNAKRDKDIHSPGFLDVETYPD